MFKLLLIIISLTLIQCATIHEEVHSLSQVNSNMVLVVGRVELIPKVNVKEEDLRVGLDLFGAKEKMINKAILTLSDKPDVGEKTQELYNPKLEKLYFFKIPKNKKYMVYGSVYLYAQTKVISKRQAIMDTGELLIPPLQFDFKSNDKAVYIGTWRIYHDEFMEMTKFEIIDEYDSANEIFKKKFGTRTTLRKALAKPLK